MNNCIKSALFGITFLLIFCLPGKVFAQQTEFAKWESNLAQASNDSLRFVALTKLFSLNARAKIDLANDYLIKAEEIAKGKQSAYYEGVVLNQRAAYFNYKGNYDSTFAYATRACEILEKSPFKIPYAKALGTLSTALGTQNQKRIDILKKCQVIYEEFKDTSSLIWTYNAIANNYTYLNKFDNALDYSNDALRLAKKSNSVADIGSTLNKICNIYFEQQKFDEAVKTGLDALEYHKKAGNTNDEIWVYITLANIFYNQNNFPKSHEYYDKALDLSLSSGIKNRIARIYLEKGNAYLLEKKYQDAETYFEKAMSAAIANNSVYFTMASNSGFADLHYEKKDYVKSIFHARTGLEIGEKLNATTDLPYLINLIGLNYFQLNNLDSASFYAEKSYSQAVAINDIKKVMDASDLLSKIYEKSGNYSGALKYFQKYKLLQDSIYNEEKARIIVEAESKFQTAQKQEEIQRLLSEQKINKLILEQREQQLILETSKNKSKEDQLALAENEAKIKDLQLTEVRLNEENQRKKLLLQQADLEMSAKNLDLANQISAKEKSLRNVSLIAVLITLVAAYLLFVHFNRKKQSEKRISLIEERLRISRELHDDLGSTLSSISVYSDVAKNRALKNAGNEEVLNKISFASRDLIDKMSDIVWSLNPGNESIDQLKNRMLAFSAMMLSPNGTSFQFDFENDLLAMVLSPEKRKNVFLIFKEAIHNIVKHAGAKNVMVSLKSKSGVLHLEIADDGVGFPALTNGNGLGGNGLHNLKSRAKDIGGELYLGKAEPSGALVRLTFKTD